MAGSLYPPRCVLLFVLSSVLFFHISSAFLSFPVAHQPVDNQVVYPVGADSSTFLNSAQEKRRSSFRSDLGKRDVISDSQSEQPGMARDLDLENIEQREIEKRVNRFRSDLGKRRYRVDLGKESSTMVHHELAMDNGLPDQGDVLFDETGVHGGEKRAKFRSDLGKRMVGLTRPTWWTGKRVFRSDLGKRRYRTDLG